MFILIGARIFSLTFYGVNGHIWVEHLLTSLPGGQVGFLIFVNMLVFLLAFFLDFFELAFIIIPLLGPAAEKLGIDLIWFGVMLGVNMQTSFMHPPFGFALFYLRSVAPNEPLRRQGHRQHDGSRDDRPDLLGRRAVRRHPVHHGGAGDRLPGHGDALQGNRPTVDPSKIEIQIPAFGGAPGGLGSPSGLNLPSFGAPPGTGPGLGTPPPDLSPPPAETPKGN